MTGRRNHNSMAGLRVLAVDDERPTLEEVTYLLGRDPRIAEVHSCSTAAEALRVLSETEIDVAFLDIKMPGLTGLDLSQVLTRFKQPPQIVFVTAHEQHAVEAFEVRAVDYVLKPVRPDRLAEAIRRVVEGAERESVPDDPSIPVERGGVTRFVRRSEISHVEAQGDYARLHTPTGSHLIRASLAALEADWGPAGFVRIHRSLLVSLAHIAEVRSSGGRTSVVVRTAARDGSEPESTIELGVARRHTRDLRDVLARGVTS